MLRCSCCCERPAQAMSLGTKALLGMSCGLCMGGLHVALGSSMPSNASMLAHRVHHVQGRDANKHRHLVLTQAMAAVRMHSPLGNTALHARESTPMLDASLPARQGGVRCQC